MIVVDTSVVATAVLDDADDGDAVRSRLRGQRLAAPALRENCSPYDAAYVALAEAFETTLLTADARLARSPGPTCKIEVLTLN